MKKLDCVLLGLVMTSVIAVGGVAEATDWSTWRGPTANGLSPETGWNPKVLNNGSSILWRANVGKGHSAVVVSQDRLYTMGALESGSGDARRFQEAVFCLDANTGREVWRYPYPTSYRNWPGPTATPVLDGDQLFVTSRAGEVLCFNAGDGRVLWKRNLVSEGLAQEPQWGFCASAAIDGNLVLLNAGRSGLALDKRTGKVVWASDPTLGWLATPVLFEMDGRRLAAISAAGAVHVVEPSSGEVLWSHPWQSDADPTIVGTRMVLTGAGQATGSAVLDIGNGSPQVVWESRDLGGAFQSAVVIDGHAFGFGRERRDNALQCVDTATGERRWSVKLGDWGSLIAADGKLIVISGDGNLIIAEATPEAYREITRSKLFDLRHWQSYPNDEPNTCWTTPTLANGKVYARTTWGELACVDLRG